ECFQLEWARNAGPRTISVQGSSTSLIHVRIKVWEALHVAWEPPNGARAQEGLAFRQFDGLRLEAIDHLIDVVRAGVCNLTVGDNIHADIQLRLDHGSHFCLQLLVRDR